MKLPSELVLASRKAQVRKAIRYRKRAARRAGERETAAWQTAEWKREWRERRA